MTERPRYHPSATKSDWIVYSELLETRLEAAEARNKILEQTIREAYAAIQRSQETGQP